MSIFDAFGDRWKSGDDVVATTGVGEGIFGSHVPEGTKGKIVRSESTLLGDDRLVVQFENGYEEIVRPSEIRKHSWW